MQVVDIISIVMQSIVAIFLIWYAIETYKLRKQTAYQNKISIQPIIDFVYDPEAPKFVETLENVGAGAAFNLHVYCWLLKESQLYGLPEEDRLSIIKPNSRAETKPLKLIDSSTIKKKHAKLTKIMDEFPSTEGFGDSIAVYQDAAGNYYYSHQYSTTAGGNPFEYGPL